MKKLMLLAAVAVLSVGCGKFDKLVNPGFTDEEKRYPGQSFANNEGSSVAIILGELSDSMTFKHNIFTNDNIEVFVRSMGADTIYTNYTTNGDEMTIYGLKTDRSFATMLLIYVRPVSTSEDTDDNHGKKKGHDKNKGGHK